MVKICQTGLLIKLWNHAKKTHFPVLAKNFRRPWMKFKNFFCHFPNPWTLRVSGMGSYTSKCEKKSKSLHPNAHDWSIHRKIPGFHSLNIHKILRTAIKLVLIFLYCCWAGSDSNSFTSAGGRLDSTVKQLFWHKVQLTAILVQGTATLLQGTATLLQGTAILVQGIQLFWNYRCSCIAKYCCPTSLLVLKKTL